MFFAGLFSTTMRDLSEIHNDSPKWIVLDGDIDPMWIESLNTVMDDNKVCLGSTCLLSLLVWCARELVLRAKSACHSRLTKLCLSGNLNSEEKGLR